MTDAWLAFYHSAWHQVERPRYCPDHPDVEVGACFVGSVYCSVCQKDRPDARPDLCPICVGLVRPEHD